MTETAALVLGSTVLGSLLAWAGLWLSSLLGRKDKDRDRAADRRARGLEVLGRVRVLLDDASPLVILINQGPQTLALYDELLRRWRAVREELMVYATAHPSRVVDEIAEEFAVAGWNALTSLGWALKALTPTMLPASREDGLTGPAAELDTARHDHQQAKLLADALVELVRHDGKVARRATLRNRTALLLLALRQSRPGRLLGRAGAWA